MLRPLLYMFVAAFFSAHPLAAQTFYLGADLSYVNEMEDCGAVYKEEGLPKDPYAIFAEHGCKLVRLRLWHTPAWYDALNEGRRYSDLADVRRSIRRARAQGMPVLLDFHLSDNWADPGKQVIPAAWNAVVDDWPVLQDSLYNYLYQTLFSLHEEGLLPEMVQIGNETNRGILLSPQVNAAGWTLDWNRNAPLFNAAIRAVRAVTHATGREIKIVIHAAGPEDAEWIFEAFLTNGVVDFDIMGISYYWAWSQPADISETGRIIEKLKSKHPAYEVMIVETGYPWTNEAQDAANNIISETHPNYRPASPEAQRRWLIDLTQTVLNAGGAGVLYWEPAWVSTGCYTQWAQGSHQEHVTFFDFEHNLIPDGGIAWLTHDYGQTTTASSLQKEKNIRVWTDQNHRHLTIEWPGDETNVRINTIQLIDIQGRILITQKIPPAAFSHRYQLRLPDLPRALYLVRIQQGNLVIDPQRVFIQQP